MKSKNKRKLNKKNIVLLVVSIVSIAILSWIGFMFIGTQKATFLIDGKEHETLDVTIEYGTTFSIVPADLKMEAKNKKDEDISDRIRYEEKEIKEVGVYEIEYSIEEADIKKTTFLVKVKVEDTTAPELNGPDEITWGINDEFVYNASEHDIHAMDVHDGNLDEKITYEGNVDVTQEGTYEVTYLVKDKFENQATHVLKVNVQEKPVVSASVDDLYKDPRSIEPTIINPDSISVLVNKYHAIPDGWEPNDLVSITSNSGRDMYLREEAATAWEELNKEAQAQGINIQVISSFRTAAYQSSLFQNYYASDGANAFLYSALSRRSEHELGLAIDVSYDGQLHEDLLNNKVGQFMNDEGYKYGFVLRYPSDKIAITGYGFEAWHYRYVGKNLAKELKQRNLVLEEY